MISVDRLTSVPSLGLSYLAGTAGGARLVTWAHACDLPDPWEWVDAGDLMMTTGSGMPVTEEAQIDWITRLIDSKVSALVIAREPHAPEVSSALLAVAENRRFPILAASFDLHFVALARTVIESAVEGERYRIATITRLYDVYWQSLHARGSFDDRVSTLEGATGLTLEVRDTSSGDCIARGRNSARATATHSDVSVAKRSSPEVSVPVPGSGDAVLVAGSARVDPVSDRVLLQHIAGLIALELEHDAVRRDSLRASGQDLLLGLLDGSIAPSAVWPELRHRGMPGPVVAVCWTSPESSPLAHESVHLDTRLQRSAPLLTYRSPMLIAIAPHDVELLSALASKLAPNCVVGLSAPLKPSGDVAESVRQAQIAASRATSMGVTAVSYDELEGNSGVFPRSVEDTRRLVVRVLGPLVTHDAASDGELVESVRVFLANDSNWQRSADQLGVHRQTLVYRLKKVEQLTELKVTSTKGSALLWLAFEAANQARLSVSELVESA
ncbi:PucR family transcriptional regulator [Rhodococcus sp. IEGM1428]|uniref:PucR family transcriptional regulator n=1 Tax=Rhodococcus sp. IEGM1428 TaxID=3392191 RepID=UPI003D0E2410